MLKKASCTKSIFLSPVDLVSQELFFATLPFTVHGRKLELFLLEALIVFDTKRQLMLHRCAPCPDAIESCENVFFVCVA
jgi:hypothetical protein